MRRRRTRAQGQTLSLNRRGGQCRHLGSEHRRLARHWCWRWCRRGRGHGSPCGGHRGAVTGELDGVGLRRRGQDRRLLPRQYRRGRGRNGRRRRSSVSESTRPALAALGIGAGVAVARVAHPVLCLRDPLIEALDLVLAELGFPVLGLAEEAKGALVFLVIDVIPAVAEQVTRPTRQHRRGDRGWRAIRRRSAGRRELLGRKVWDHQSGPEDRRGQDRSWATQDTPPCWLVRTTPAETPEARDVAIPFNLEIVWSPRRWPFKNDQAGPRPDSLSLVKLE